MSNKIRLRKTLGKPGIRQRAIERQHAHARAVYKVPKSQIDHIPDFDQGSIFDDRPLILRGVSRHRARKTYVCGCTHEKGPCAATINPGDLYSRLRVIDKDADNGRGKYSEITVCGDCRSAHVPWLQNGDEG